MNAFLQKLFLKTQISFFKKVVLAHIVLRKIASLGLFIKDFLFSSWKFFLSLNRPYKIFVTVFMVTLFLSGGIIVKSTYSQTLSSTADSNRVSQNPYQNQSSIPSNLVQNELIQFFQFGNNVMQGQKDSNGKVIGFGINNFISGLDAYVYENNPVSFVKYSSYYAKSHELVKSSYADSQGTTGTGYSALQPIIPLWEIARNVSYLVIALMIVVIGFIIIFGGKYGQSEVTVVSSIPKILIAIILITFSFPIAGLAIDVSNLGTNIIVNLLGPRFVQQNYFYPGQYPVGCGTNYISVPSDNASVNGTSLKTGQEIEACDFFATNAGNAIAKGLGGDFNIFRLMSPIINYQDWNPTTKGTDSILALVQTPTDIGFLDAFLNGVPFNIGSEGTILVVTFIMNVLMLFWAIKIFIMIMTSFIRIVTQALLGPFILIGYTLNGNNTLWGYIRGLLAPALVFPIIFAMLFVAAILAYGADCFHKDGSSSPCVENANDHYSQGPWYINHNIGITNFNNGPLMVVDTINPNFIWNFVALGIVIAIPGVGKQIDELLKAEVSRHLEAQTSDATKRAAGYAARIPFVGGVIGKIL